MKADRPYDPDWNWAEIYTTQRLEVLILGDWGIHLKVKRWDEKDIQCTWDVLQRIKSDILGEDALAIEFYPPESLAVNEVNVRHLWVFPSSIIAVEHLPLRPR